MTDKTRIALIISTADQPDYLSRVLRALEAQSIAPAEVLLADDGSGPETGKLFESWADGKGFETKHFWQEKAGFRKARILNEAIANARSEYVVFLDGDTIPHPEFIADHSRMTRPASFVQGHRTLIKERAAVWFGLQNFEEDRRRAFWQGQLGGWKFAFRWPRPLIRTRQDLRGVRGCNLGVWRADLVQVNGYNEAFVGWGREDSELAVRLMNSGIRRRDVRGWGLCYHLWHPPASRSGLGANDELLAEALGTRARRCVLGLNQHLPVGTQAGPPRQ
jgi:glycosyltransferase involved in cell wall biosynthesis